MDPFSEKVLANGLALICLLWPAVSSELIRWLNLTNILHLQHLKSARYMMYAHWTLLSSAQGVV